MMTVLGFPVSIKISGVLCAGLPIDRISLFTIIHAFHENDTVEPQPQTASHNFMKL